MKGFFFFIAFFTLIIKNVYSQKYISVSPPPNIKTVQLRSFNSGEKLDIFPIISLGNYFTLSFDDINATESLYYYNIKHYDSYWNASKIFQNDYLEGFNQIPIQDIKGSFNTLQSYTHYNLTFPNENIQLKISGNYAIEILDSSGELLFNRRFIVHEDISNVNSYILRPRNLDLFQTHQNIQFDVSISTLSFRDPLKDIKIVLLKNYNWETAKYDISPQYIENNQLLFRYDKETQFEGGDEFLFFDTKNAGIRVYNINQVVIGEDGLYTNYLFPDVVTNESDYFFRQDINGDYLIQNIKGVKSEIDADYHWVYFQLATVTSPDEEIYVYGAFNNFALTSENKMTFNPSSKLFEAKILFKQGFYNYTYVTKKEGKVCLTCLTGNYAQTENNYLILVYYQNLGTPYDRLIGVGQASSFDIKN